MIKNTKGSITLETSIILPIFILLFLAVYGLFSVVSAQSKISHAFVQATKSLSMDSYLNESVESAAEAKTKFWGGLDDMVLDLVRVDNNSYFSSQTDWYQNANGNPDIAKKRFIGYLSGGDEDAAREMCESLNIVNGLDGIKFEMSIAEEKLTLTIKYEIQYWFDFWDMGKIPMEQTITSRMWMAGD